MSAPRPWLLLLGAIVVVAALYAPVLSGPFLWDDRHLIADSRLVRELGPIVDYFRLPFWSGAETGPTVSFHYRPLTVLSLALDRRIHLDNPSGFHLTNLLLHVANVALVFVLGLRRGASGLASAIAAAAFGLLPRLCEAAAWISGRTDLLATFFVLLSLWVSKKQGQLWAIVAALCALFGLFSKEVAIAGVAALVVHALLERRRLGARAALMRLGSLGVVLAIYGGLRIAVTLHAPTQRLDSGARLLTVFEAIGRYFVMTIDPWQPRTQIGQPQQPALGIVLVGAIALVGLMFVMVRWRRSFSAETWSLLALALVPVGLVLHLIPLSIGVVAADRFLYLPMAALALLLAPRLDALFALRRAFVPAALFVVATLGFRSSARVADFASEARFWFDALDTTPRTNSLPAVELGGVYYRAGLYSQAQALYRRAAEARNPEAVSAHAICLGWLGSYDEARSLIERSIHARPAVPKYWLDRALIELHDLEFEQARAAAAKALELYPRYEQAKEVIELTRELERIAPKVLARSDATDRAALLEQARFFTRAGRYPDALRSWQGLLSEADLDEDTAFEAWAYIVRFEEPAILAKMQPPLRLRTLAALRLDTARELDEAWQKAKLGT